MKKYMFVIGGLLALAAVLFVSQLPSQSRAEALGVKDVGADPAAYVGEITIVGIMTAVSQEDATIFGIMDVAELQCQLENCNKIILPIQHGGQTPAMGDEVLVTGSFTDTPRGRLFKASNVKVVRNHQLGG